MLGAIVVSMHKADTDLIAFVNGFVDVGEEIFHSLYELRRAYH